MKDENPNSKYHKKFIIQREFPDILSNFVKEILRTKPKDIVDFGVNYFKNKEEESKPKKISITNITNTNNIEISQFKSPNKNNNLTTVNKNKIVTKKSMTDKKINSTVKKIPILAASSFAPKKNISKNLDNTDENFYSLKLYEDCINFPDKEKILNKLKEKSIGNSCNKDIVSYINNYFLPNKKYNEILIKAQNTIMCYYISKGTENESEFNKSYEEIKNDVAKLNNTFLLSDFEKMDAKDAIKEFKNNDFYLRMIKCYLLKLKFLSKNVYKSNDLIDEMCYFIFFNQLKTILENDKSKKIIEANDYIEDYFNINFKLLITDIYSFVLGAKYFDVHELKNIFSNFSILKRELTYKYLCFYSLVYDKKKELNEKIRIIGLSKYNSSPDQIIKFINESKSKISKIGEEILDEEIENLERKIEEYYPHIWLFITKIINTPFEVIHNNINEFMLFRTCEREIILKYLQLSNDYMDIYNKFNDLKINNNESNFAYLMRHLYFNIKYIPELNIVNMCIYRNHLYEIPESVSNYLKNFNNFESENINEKKLVDEFKKQNILVQNGLYSYLLIKKKEKPFLENLLEKLKLQKEKYESLLYRMHVDSLKKNFSVESDEIVELKQNYNEWKKKITPCLLNILNIKDDKEKIKFFGTVPDEPNKIIVFNIIAIEIAIHEEKSTSQLLNNIREKYPDVDELFFKS